MKIREVLMTIAVLYPVAGYSASFDCQKATQADEKAICANRMRQLQPLFDEII